jgi:hypothetical protein
MQSVERYIAKAAQDRANLALQQAILIHRRIAYRVLIWHARAEPDIVRKRHSYRMASPAL